LNDVYDCVSWFPQLELSLIINDGHKIAMGMVAYSNDLSPVTDLQGALKSPTLHLKHISNTIFTNAVEPLALRREREPDKVTTSALS